MDPAQQSARKLITDYADTVAEPTGDSAWPWPEPRLSYANAALPEAMIAAGVALDRAQLREQGLDLLAWLLEHETVDGHLSPTPMQGSAPGDPRPAFDQSPSEASALADACAARPPSTPGRSGSTASTPSWPGSRVSTMRDNRCGTRRPAADTTSCTPTVSPPIKARQRPLRCCRRCSTRGVSPLFRSNQYLLGAQRDWRYLAAPALLDEAAALACLAVFNGPFVVEAPKPAAAALT